MTHTQVLLGKSVQSSAREKVSFHTALQDRGAGAWTEFRQQAQAALWGRNRNHKLGGLGRDKA